MAKPLCFDLRTFKTAGYFSWVQKVKLYNSIFSVVNQALESKQGVFPPDHHTTFLCENMYEIIIV